MPDHDGSPLADRSPLTNQSDLAERGALAGQSDLTDRSTLASPSVATHLTRGAIGFGLIGVAFALTPGAGPGALLLAVPGMVALRGCPTCWIAGLIATISAGRLERTCTEDGCSLQSPRG
jgi:hypothetical protein